VLGAESALMNDVAHPSTLVPSENTRRHRCQGERAPLVP